MDPVKAKAAVRSTRPIDGWLEPEAGYLFALLDEAQRAAGIDGDAVEIGVHHGKSALLLGSMLDRSAESLIVCDVFDAQGSNPTESGRGDKATFMANVGEWFADTSFLRVYEKPSSELTVEELGRRCRLFHIDGGHSCEEALGDLRLGAACLREGGAIVVDDPFHPAWPGVSEAIVGFLHDPGEVPFVPLVLGFNKLVIVRAGDEPIYRRLLDDPAAREAFIPRAPHQLKRLTLAGSEVYVFYRPTYRRRVLDGGELYRLYFQNADRVPDWVTRPVGWARSAKRALAR
jgi:Methyltransferase domain